MAKSSIDIVKYVIHADIEIDGMVEKPDVVGAIFGQTEGLLGDDLDIRELQKNGRIGRIEIDITSAKGKVKGKLNIPSSLDKVDTAIIAAAVETVDRVGPCDARVKVLDVEDTRYLKREFIIDRSKHILEEMIKGSTPESKEISELVRKKVRIGECLEYGPDHLPAGPDVQKADEIILVEGRADVLNLLQYGIQNVVGVGGASVPQSLAKLCTEKEVTAFLDGDRGGDIILKELHQIADIDFVARAPVGKEVEELTRKEIIQALRRRVPVEQEDNGKKQAAAEQQRAEPVFQSREQRSWAREPVPQGGMPPRDIPQRDVSPVQGDVPQIQSDVPQIVAPPKEIQQREFQRRDAYQRGSPRDDMSQRGPRRHHERHAMERAAQQVREEAPKAVKSPLDDATKEKFTSILNELIGSLKARIFNKEFSVVGEVPIRELVRVLQEMDNVHAIVFDGVITQRLADLANQKNVAYLVGIRKMDLEREPESTCLVALG